MDTTTTRGSLFALSVPRRKSWDPGEVTSDPVSSLSQTSDEVLLKFVQEGDRDALSSLFRRYAKTLRALGTKILRDAAEAEDLVQEIFLYIYQKCQLYDRSKGSARSWLFQIAYTQAFLRRRKLKSRGFYVAGIVDKEVERDQVDGIGAAYDHTVEGLFGRNVWKNIIDGLTDDQRETLRLHFFEGYTFAEIAEKLGQTYANIRHHHYRALEKLRKHLVENATNRR